MGFVEDMQQRGMIAQITHEAEIIKYLAEGKRTAYIGFDPTGESLHVGHLLPIMALRRWQKAGHRAIALVGGGTAQVGDPTGKTEMRKLEDRSIIGQRIELLKNQLGRLVDIDDGDSGIVVNNGDWLNDLNYLEFLREVGRHFSVNRMLTAECFKQRLEKGLSFLEFNYMILQSYDFLELFDRYQCSFQLGGDDQWSNMLGGMDLIRKMRQSQAFCCTVPLLVSSQGKKMGKTEKGAVWLDENLTSPYEFYQYFRNLSDDMIEKCLFYFTDLTVEEVKQLSSPSEDINKAKSVLGYEVTKLIHGDKKAHEAVETAKKLFSAGNSEVDLDKIPKFSLDGSTLPSEVLVVDLLQKSQILPSKSEARRLIQQGGLLIEGKKVENVNSTLRTCEVRGSKGLLVKKGKKHYFHLTIL